MNKKFIHIIWLICVLGVSYPVAAQSAEGIKEVLTGICNRIVVGTSYQIIDTASQEILHKVDLGEVSPTVKVKSDYNEWTYFNGAMLAGLLRVGEVTGNPRYVDYVIKNFDFIFDHLDYFQYQWEVLQVKQASFYRVFRMNLLDDCGAMGAALIDAYHQKKRDDRYLKMIRRIANYINNVQLRLEDGTLSRPDPRYMTLWVDDLYMSVPFLARMGKLTGEGRYFDDAARQVIQFLDRLLDSETKVLHHAWFSDSKERSVARWGRGNGWALMAQVELLSLLPRNHPQRDSLLSLVRTHINGLAPLQDSTGLWHQVLDRQDSYLETSCTAMFTYGIAKAVNESWLDSSFASVARQGWAGVLSRIQSDGQIEGICRGTGVGFDLDFYFARPTPLNDPRGIGGVLLAGAEMIKLSQRKTK